MPVRFVDTSIFLRFLTRDDPTKFARCRRLFEQTVAGSFSLWTSDLVIVEVIWSLLTYYDLPKPVVIEKIGQILNTSNLPVTNQEVLIEALVLWSRHNCDFTDAYTAVLIHRDGLSGLISYDADFDVFPFTRRQEP